MKYLIALFLCLPGLAQTQMVATLHEPMQYAETLPDGRVVVLTPQRLLLLGDGPEHEILAEFANARQTQRSFTIHDNLVYLPEGARQIHILDLEDELRALPPVRVSVSHYGPPMIADGHLYVIESFRSLIVYSLADPRSPQRIAKLPMPDNGTAYRLLAHKDHVFMYDRAGILAVDVRTPQEPKIIGERLKMRAERPGAMFARDDRLYVFTGRELAVIDVADPTAMTVVHTEEKVPICDDVLPRADGVLGVRGEMRLRVRPTADGVEVEANVDELPLAGGDEASLRAARFWPLHGFRGAVPVNDTQLCMFDSKTARIVDLSALENPKVIGETPFDVSYRPAYVLRDGIAYTQRGGLDLRTPQAPLRFPLQPTIALTLDDERMVTLLWKHIGVWNLSNPLKPERSAQLPFEERAFGIVSLDGIFYISVEGAIRVVTIEDGEAKVIGQYEFADRDRPTAMTWDGDTLVATMYHHGILRFDVSDPTQPRVSKTFNWRRADRPVVVDGVVFAVVMTRGLVAVDMRESARRPFLEQGPVVSGDGTFLRMGDHLVIGQPGAGCALYHSPLLVRLREEREAREALATKLTGEAADLPVLQELAALCVAHGQWRLAAKHFTRIEELGGDTTAGVAFAEMRRKRRHAGKEFEAAIERRAFIVQSNEAKEIVQLTVNEPAALMTHIQHIHSLPALASVDLHAAARKEHLEALIGARLTSLTFRGEQMAAADFAALARFTELARLDLSHSSFDDAAMVHLQPMSRLRDIDLRGTQVTDEGVARLRQQFPETRVHFRTPQAQEGELTQRPAQPAPILPSTFAFELADNTLLLLHPDNGRELERAHPGEAFGDDDIQLTAIAPELKYCWVGSDAGLMRYDPSTAVWSRFAIDRTHLDVTVDALEISDGHLVVRYGANSATFDLANRRWLEPEEPAIVPTREVAESATAAVQAPPPADHFPLIVLAISAALIGVFGFVILRRSG